MSTLLNAVERQFAAWVSNEQRMQQFLVDVSRRALEDAQDTMCQGARRP
jgi:hypothetical protein